MMTTLSTKLLTATAALLLAAAVHAEDTTAKSLTVGNLFANPDFSGKPCFEHWTPKVQTDKNVICRYPGSVWLNHNNKAGDPAIAQTVSGLDTRKDYVLEVSWRPGATAHLYVKSIVPYPIFEVKVGAKPILYSANVGQTEFKTERHVFKPSGKTMTFEFLGEAGDYDGDVEVQWVSLRSVEEESRIARTAVTKLIPPNKYAVKYVDKNGNVSSGGDIITLSKNGYFVHDRPQQAPYTGYMRMVDGQACFENPRLGYPYPCFIVTKEANGVLKMDPGPAGSKHFYFRYVPVTE